MKKKLAVLGATALLLLGATGCSTKLEKAQDQINDSIVTVLNSSDYVDTITNVNFDKYIFLAGDYENTGSGNYVVDINGLASYNNNSQKAYVSLQYEVSENVFKDIHPEKAHEVVSALNQIVQQYQMKEFSFSPMNNITEFNTQMGEVFESPIDGYKHSSSLTYKVKDIQFNEKEGYVSFTTKSNVRYYDTKNELQYVMVGVDSNGKPKMGWRNVIKTDYETFNQDYQIYIRVSPEEMKAMQQDPSKIFDKFVDLVKDKNKEDITVRSISVQTDKEFNDDSGYSM